ncbi:MAG: DNA-processing protein DprA [Elusimicrobiales bacterium]
MTLAAEDRLARLRAAGYCWLRTDWFLRLERLCGGAAQALKLSPAALSAQGGMSAGTAEQFLKDSAAVNPQAELDKTAKAGGKIVFLGEEDYPAQLAEIIDPPLALYILGNADFPRAAAAIVGTRKPTAYGRRVAARLARDMSECGLVIASGLARGIDSVAHAAALEAKGATWAVIGTGIGRCYPAENADLAREIVKGGGAIISEYNFDTGPKPHHFPRRNRIISGLSRAVAVIEGAVTSGALITAKLALEQGREVFAVPGLIDNPMSEGPNLLIKDGAGVLRNAADIIDALPLHCRFGIKMPEQSNAALAPKAPAVPLSRDEAAALECIGAQSLTLDAVVEKTGWTVPRAAAALFELETKSAVTCRNGEYSRKL